jgi:hypothetical protein
VTHVVYGDHVQSPPQILGFSASRRVFGTCEKVHQEAGLLF